MHRNTSQRPRPEGHRRSPAWALLAAMLLILTSLVAIDQTPAFSQSNDGDPETADQSEEVDEVEEAERATAATRAELETVQADLEAALANQESYERQVAVLAARVRAQDISLAALAEERDDFEEQAAEAEAALLAPTTLRRELASTAYVRGDARLAAAYEDLLGSGSTQASAQTRNLLDAVDTWADAQVTAAENDLAVAEVEAEARRDRIEETESARFQVQSDLGDLLGEAANELETIDALRAEAGELQLKLREQRVIAELAALSGLNETDPETDGEGEEFEEPEPALVRPALAVKIDNAPRARPQSGLARADVVFEEIVEGRLTRFVAVFQSRDADPIGPIRSARTSDVHILGNLNNPLFANSGGNPGTLAIVNDSPLIDVGATSNGGAFRRDGSRAAPHNLYSSTKALYAADGGRAGLPPQMFTFRSLDAPLSPTAQPVNGFDVAYGLTTGSHTWDEDLGGWRRATDGRAHNDASGAVLAPENVVVQFIEYGASPADARSPEAIMTGEGEAWIFTDGHVVRGTWSRPTDEDITIYQAPDGSEIPLTPGQTWVLLPKAGQVSFR